MTKIVINANDTPEEIEQKIKEGFAHILLIIEAYNKHFGPSFNGRTSDSESGNEGSIPSEPAKGCIRCKAPVDHWYEEHGDWSCRKGMS